MPDFETFVVRAPFEADIVLRREMIATGQKVGHAKMTTAPAARTIGARMIGAPSRTACRTRMARDPEFNAAVFEGATRALALSIDHMTMVGRSSAEERLAWFLTMLRDRAAIPGCEPATVELVMQRQDIADYLGVTIETVSRTFTALKERGIIALPTTRRVEILKPKSLERLASADRDAPAWDHRICA